MKSDFPQFSSIQLSILPDVQKIDLTQFENLLSKDEVIICKDQNTGDMAGFAIVKNNESHGLLRQLAVSNDFRRKGIASLLVSACIEWFENHNLNRIHIYVKKKNEAAIGLYKKFEFEISLERHQFIIDWKLFLNSNQNPIHRSGTSLELINLNPEQDKLINQKYGISLNELTSFREAENSQNIGIFQKEELIGFTRLRPDFPVLTPIYLNVAIDIIYVLNQIKQFCNPSYDYLKITIEDPLQIKIIKLQEWSELNFTLVKMSSTL